MSLLLPPPIPPPSTLPHSNLPHDTFPSSEVGSFMDVPQHEHLSPSGQRHVFPAPLDSGAALTRRDSLLSHPSRSSILSFVHGGEPSEAPPSSAGGDATSPPVSEISLLGSVSLLFSSMTGPGLVTIPLLFQQAGWFTPLLAILVAAAMSAAASLFTVEAMSLVPGNSSFRRKIEFSSLVEAYFGRRSRYIAHLWLYLAIQSLSLASIIISVQSMDGLILSLFHRTCGVSFTQGWICVAGDKTANSPFGDEYMFLSAGYVLAAALVLPLSLLNLVDNIKAQIISLVSLVVVVIAWVILFLIHGLHPERIPFIGPDQSQVVGTVMFNYVYMTTIPSWVNAKNASVSTQTSVWGSTALATALYLLVGIFGALSYQIPSDGNILSVIGTGPEATVLTKITAFIFPLATLITSIPVCTIVVRYNLTRGGICGPRMANLLAAGVPWIVTIPFQTGSWLNSIINWGSLLFTAAVNFAIPFILFLLGRRRNLRDGGWSASSLDLARPCESDGAESKEEDPPRCPPLPSVILTREFTGEERVIASGGVRLSLGPSSGSRRTEYIPEKIEEEVVGGEDKDEPHGGHEGGVVDGSRPTSLTLPVDTRMGSRSASEGRLPSEMGLGPGGQLLRSSPSSPGSIDPSSRLSPLWSGSGAGNGRRAPSIHTRSTPAIILLPETPVENVRDEEEESSGMTPRWALWPWYGIWSRRGKGACIGPGQATPVTFRAFPDRYQPILIAWTGLALTGGIIVIMFIYDVLVSIGRIDG